MLRVLSVSAILTAGLAFPVNASEERKRSPEVRSSQEQAAVIYTALDDKDSSTRAAAATAESAGTDLRQIARDYIPEKTGFVEFRSRFDFTKTAEFGIVHIAREGDLIAYSLGNNRRLEQWRKSFEKDAGEPVHLATDGAGFGSMVEQGIWAGTSAMSSDDGHEVECVLRFRVVDRRLHENACAGHVADVRIVEATEAGDRDEVARLIAAGVDVNQKGEQGRTALAYASFKGDAETARLLLEGGAVVGSTELLNAARLGHAELAKALIGAGSAVDVHGKDGATPLAFAAYFGHTGVVEALLEAKAAVNQQTADGRTALYLAASQGHPDVVRALLKAGADPSLAHADGRSPLHVSKTTVVAELLLTRGADIEALTKLRVSPLTLAARQGRVALVRFLLDKGAKIDQRASDGSNALILASYYGHADVVAELLAAGAPVDVQSSDGRSALMCAAGQGHVDVVRALLERDADRTLEDAGGDTALDMAKDPAILEMLTGTLRGE